MEQLRGRCQVWKWDKSVIGSRPWSVEELWRTSWRCLDVCRQRCVCGSLVSLIMTHSRTHTHYTISWCLISELISFQEWGKWWFISTSGSDLSHVFVKHSFQIFVAGFCGLLNCVNGPSHAFVDFCFGRVSPVKKLAAVWRWEVRGAFFHLHYCASHPSAPPSALHPTPLCHFCSLISFTSAFSAGFLWNPTANDGAYPVPLSCALIISPPPSFFSFLTPFLWEFTCLFLSYPERSPQCFVCELKKEGFLSPWACNLSIIALFSPVIPDSDWSLWRLRPKKHLNLYGKASIIIPLERASTQFTSADVLRDS